MMQANKVTMWNTALSMEQTEICNNERLAQLKALPFIIDVRVERIEYEDQYICGIGGVTPAFRELWESV